MARRATKALLPQRETTMLVEGITKKVIKCTARKGFTLGHVSVQKGETFFLVRSERRENRSYIVKFNADRHCYQCSCGCGTCEHEHLRAVREYVMVKVVVPAKGTEATPMTVPATVTQVKARKNKVAQPATEVVEPRESVEQTMVKAAAALPVKLPKVTLVAVEHKASHQMEVEEAKKEAIIEEEIARRLSLLKSEKMDGLKFIAAKRGLDIKSRKRIDSINAIISSVRLQLESDHGMAA